VVKFSGMLNSMKLARLHHLAKAEPYWHVQLAVAVAIALQLFLSNRLTVGPKYVIAAFECLLVIALALFARKGHHTILGVRRSLASILIALISMANIASLILVINELLNSKQVSGNQLILSALAIYLTNIIIFGLWYWELDNAGTNPEPDAMPIDFLFPQMASQNDIKTLSGWSPTFLDYLYVSATNASAFSPTDTMPLTHRAKVLMGLQSTVSLITVALVAARAVNILS